MKLLLDTCVWGPTADVLRVAGHDVDWVGDWTEDPGDEEILATAYAEERILITLDKDFGELAVLHGARHHGILRLVGFSARRQAGACRAVLRKHGDELFAGAIVTAQPGRMKIRPPEKGAADQIETATTTTPSLQDDELLSDKNWQRAVIEALEELPTDIRMSVGHSPPTTRMVIINVSVEPWPDEGQTNVETDVAKVEVTYWDSMRKYGWPRDFDEFYGPGGAFEERTDWPLVTLRGDSTPGEPGLFIGRANVADLKREVQMMVLEEMWCGEMIGKDTKDRFIRDDGSPILSWQFRKRKRHRKRSDDLR